ncbi:hypothetical protein NHX12_010610 [Muraenolepis orangiensis]|uniref:Uncharacterized protein n=1 Tax=Muraenolepis orangiensis TaxID=630683 RepID=A0A9Q0I9I2_9TELE|nr:hypothetical protein NHX12_010135 [Muraenolepis orangiensis]KAJ3589768.1 hypothetical protein NHX12_010610 [Muraenolepis orangiensis]
MNFSEEDNTFKLVRAIKGGGTRHVCVERQSKLSPNGLCKSLKLTDQVRRICDFAQNDIDPDCTVEDLYEKNKVKILRLYLCTNRNVQEANSFTDTPPVTPSEVIGNTSQCQASEPEVIIDLPSMSDPDVINLLIPHAELLTYEEASDVEFISDSNEEGRIIYVGERRQDQGTLELTAEMFRIEEEEDQDTGVSEALPEAHDAAMQRNTSTHDEVIFGPSLSPPVDLDDTLHDDEVTFGPSLSHPVDLDDTLHDDEVTFGPSLSHPVDLDDTLHDDEVTFGPSLSHPVDLDDTLHDDEVTFGPSLSPPVDLDDTLHDDEVTFGPSLSHPVDLDDTLHDDEVTFGPSLSPPVDLDDTLHDDEVTFGPSLSHPVDLDDTLHDDEVTFGPSLSPPVDLDDTLHDDEVTFGPSLSPPVDLDDILHDDEVTFGPSLSHPVDLDDTLHDDEVTFGPSLSPPVDLDDTLHDDEVTFGPSLSHPVDLDDTLHDDEVTFGPSLSPPVDLDDTLHDDEVTFGPSLSHPVDLDDTLHDDEVTFGPSLSPPVDLDDTLHDDEVTFGPSLSPPVDLDDTLHDDEVTFGPSLSHPVDLDDTLHDDEVTFGPSLSPPVDLDDTLHWEGSKPKVTIVVRRENCLTDLLAAFIYPEMMNKDVDIKMKLPNGEMEDGEGSGVLRDCLSEFWGEFYSKCTLGTNVKTPYLRHEYQVQEWQSIARILVTGWTMVRYFPLLLSLPFLEECMYDINYSSVKESFLQYVSIQEREILELALMSFNSVEKDDLLDVHMTATRLPLKTTLD